MFSVQEIERYKSALARQLEDKKQQIYVQQSQLESELAKTDAISERLHTQPPSGACYRCYYETGAAVTVRPIPAAPFDPRIDRFRCENGHDF